MYTTPAITPAPEHIQRRAAYLVARGLDHRSAYIIAKGMPAKPRRTVSMTYCKGNTRKHSRVRI